MGKKRISLSLSTSDIDKAIREIDRFEKDFISKCDQLIEKIAQAIAKEAQQRFDSAIVDDLTSQSGEPIKANVNVRCEKRGDVYVIIADGEDAVWVEFGAGVYHNGGIGQSPNPYSVQNHLGFVIGGFGEKGKKNTWGFYDQDGSLRLTHGTPAKMPMYNAVQSIGGEIVAIAREVFG